MAEAGSIGAPSIPILFLPRLYNHLLELELELRNTNPYDTKANAVGRSGQGRFVPACCGWALSLGDFAGALVSLHWQNHAQS